MSVLPDFLRPEPGEYPAYYDDYFACLPDGDLFAILGGQPQALRELLGSLNTEQQRHRYAAGKWSLKEVVRHLVDTERIFAYRGLRILRGDATPLPGFDQDAYVAASDFENRPFESLLEEFETLRRSNVLFLRGHPPESYMEEGIACEHRISLRAILKVMAGHVEHHRTILLERYLTS